jgi:hypothetical protein
MPIFKNNLKRYSKLKEELDSLLSTEFEDCFLNCLKEVFNILNLIIISITLYNQ